MKRTARRILFAGLLLLATAGALTVYLWLTSPLWLYGLIIALPISAAGVVLLVGGFLLHSDYDSSATGSY